MYKRPSLPYVARHREKDVKAGRNAAIDVLRCLLMFGVVLQHAISFCHCGGLTWTRPLLVLITLSFPCVDGFTAISGWFGVRCSVKKLVRLVALIAYCGILAFALYGVSRYFLGELYFAKFGVELPEQCFSFDVFRYWYLGAYIKLMLLTILLNPLFGFVGKLAKRWILLLLVLFVAASYLSTGILPWGSHTPRTVIFVYVVVRFLVLLDVGRLLKEVAGMRFAVWLLLLAAYAVFVCFALRFDSEQFHNYHNPITVLAGVLLLLVAIIAPIGNDSKWAKLCVYLGPSMIAVYMLNVALLTSAFRPVPEALSAVAPPPHTHLPLRRLISSLPWSCSHCVRRSTCCGGQCWNGSENGFRGIIGKWPNGELHVLDRQKAEVKGQMLSDGFRHFRTLLRNSAIGMCNLI